MALDAARRIPTVVGEMIPARSGYFLEEAYRFSVAFVSRIVSVNNFYDFHIFVGGILDGFFHITDPFVLVGCLSCCGKDGNLTFIVTEFSNQTNLLCSNQVGVRGCKGYGPSAGRDI